MVIYDPNFVSLHGHLRPVPKVGGSSSKKSCRPDRKDYDDYKDRVVTIKEDTGSLSGSWFLRTPD